MPALRGTQFDLPTEHRQGFLEPREPRWVMRVGKTPRVLLIEFHAARKLSIAALWHHCSVVNHKIADGGILSVPGVSQLRWEHQIFSQRRAHGSAMV